MARSIAWGPWRPFQSTVANGQWRLRRWGLRLKDREQMTEVALDRKHQPRTFPGRRSAQAAADKLNGDT